MGGSPMSRVESKKWSCRMSKKHPCPMVPLENADVSCQFKEISKFMSLVFLMSISLMSHDNFKKQPCRHVGFQVQGPRISLMVHMVMY